MQRLIHFACIACKNALFTRPGCFEKCMAGTTSWREQCKFKSGKPVYREGENNGEKGHDGN